MRAALAIENASAFSQMPLQVEELHASTNSSGSRSAFGGGSFSANASAWAPLTLRGVAASVRARTKRLYRMRFVVELADARLPIANSLA